MTTTTLCRIIERLGEQACDKAVNQPGDTCGKHQYCGPHGAHHGIDGDGCEHYGQWLSRETAGYSYDPATNMVTAPNGAQYEGANICEMSGCNDIGHLCGAY